MKTDLSELLKTDGYVIIHLNGADELIDTVNDDIERLIASGAYRTNAKFYSYNDSPRVVESWKHSESVKRLSKHPQVLELLEEHFGTRVRPFSTINFIRSTEQPLHSDYVHFGTVPPFQLAAAWIALEDIDPRSGPIQLVPRSHLWAEFEYQQLGLPVARSIGDVRRYYSIYEDWVRDEVSKTNSIVLTPEIRRGDAIIWLANLLHGSPECIDNKLSRRSQVTHYYTENVRTYYNPAFSQPTNAKYASRVVEFIDDDAN